MPPGGEISLLRIADMRSMLEVPLGGLSGERIQSFAEGKATLAVFSRIAKKSSDDACAEGAFPWHRLLIRRIIYEDK